MKLRFVQGYETMGGMTVLLIGCAILALVLGVGAGYAVAAGRFAASLQALTRAQQDLQRQLAAANARNVGNSPETSKIIEPPNPAVVVINSGSSPAPVCQNESLAATSSVTAHQVEKPSVTETTQQIAPAPAAESPASSQSQEDRSVFPSFVATAHQAGALLIVHVDHLRRFGERYGPQLSEYLSNHVEQVIRDALEGTAAVISRYEEQEFLVALAELAGNEKERLLAARRAASELRSDIERAFLQFGSERLTVTASIGVALVEKQIPGEQIIARADEALHAAKRAGRNCAYYHLKNGECLSVDPLVDPKVEEAKVDPHSEQAVATRRRARANGGCRDRRRHERIPCNGVNLIAPCSDNIIPAIDKFERVQFLDLSVSGFSMILPAVPTTNRFAVALFNTRGMIFMSAEVANVRQAPRAGHGKPLVVVGCKFRQRLYPTEPMPNLVAPSRTDDEVISAILQSL